MTERKSGAAEYISNPDNGHQDTRITMLRTERRRCPYCDGTGRLPEKKKDAKAMTTPTDDLVERERRAAARTKSKFIIELTCALTSANAEIKQLRAALAQSELPCAYCSLSREDWNKCQSGFPGCSRADDAMGCPELGAALERDSLRHELAASQECAMKLEVKAWGLERDLVASQAREIKVRWEGNHAYVGTLLVGHISQWIAPPNWYWACDLKTNSPRGEEMDEPSARAAVEAAAIQTLTKDPTS